MLLFRQFSKATAFLALCLLEGSGSLGFLSLRASCVFSSPLAAVVHGFCFVALLLCGPLSTFFFVFFFSLINKFLFRIKNREDIF